MHQQRRKLGLLQSSANHGSQREPLIQEQKGHQSQQSNYQTNREKVAMQVQ